MSPYLGIDYGLSRIGLAVSDESETIAFALGVHETASGESFFKVMCDVIRERNITGLVVGLPLTAAGDEGKMAQRVRQFVQKLAQVTEVPVTLEDERYSSQEADRYLRQSGLRRRPKGEVDALSAQIILQQYLDRRARRQTPSAGE